VDHGLGRFSVSTGGMETIECSGLAAQYVFIVMPEQRQYLTVCEVQVHGLIESVRSELTEELQAGIASGKYKEIGQGKPTAQSSMAFGGVAKRAVDGNIAQAFFRKSCTHTKKEESPWWRVDLGDMYKVQAVSVWNRADCCGNRLRGFEVMVGESQSWNKNRPCDPGQSTGPQDRIVPQGGHQMLQCAEYIHGRYVFVVLPFKTQYLTVCEVRVIADAASAGQPIPDRAPEAGLKDPKLVKLANGIAKAEDLVHQREAEVLKRLQKAEKERMRELEHASATGEIGTASSGQSKQLSHPTTVHTELSEIERHHQLRKTYEGRRSVLGALFGAVVLLGAVVLGMIWYMREAQNEVAYMQVSTGDMGQDSAGAPVCGMDDMEEDVESANGAVTEAEDAML